MKEKYYHIDTYEGQLGKYVFLPGDPFRTDLIAEFLDNPILIAHNREYRSWNGYLDGELVSVVSTGIGGASAAIAIEELIKGGSHTFIRIGTAGRVSAEAKNKDVQGVICTGAIRDEGLTKEYMPLSYPAIANIELVNALNESRDKFDYNYINGITHCKDSFYGQMEPERIPIYEELNARWKVLERANVACAEMESATLFVLGTIYQKRAASIMNFDDNMGKTISIAIDAMRSIIKKDKDIK